MTRFTKIMGLCLVAVFVMSAVAVATASAAEPEFVFSGSKAFSTKSTEKGKLETSIGEEVKCTEESGTGEIEGTSGSKKVTKDFTFFKGCTTEILAKVYNCQSASRATGEIATNELEGELGYINKTNKEVGLLLKPKSPATLFAEFECVNGANKTKIKVKGSIIGRIPTTSINSLIDITSYLLLDYGKGAAKGEPEIKSFEGLSEDHLLTESTASKAFNNFSIEASIRFYFSVSITIKA